MKDTQPASPGQRKPYDPPTVQTYSSSELLSDLGPALAVYGELADLNP